MQQRLLSSSDELNDLIEVIAELHDNANNDIKELILTELEELIQLVQTKNRESWDD